MVGPRVRINSCKGCGLCVAVCPAKILALADRINARGVCYAACSEPEKCTDCGLCYMICPDAAIEVVELGRERARKIA